MKKFRSPFHNPPFSFIGENIYKSRKKPKNIKAEIQKENNRDPSPSNFLNFLIGEDNNSF